jgi:hypothetical protein
MLRTLVGTVLLAATTSLFAQAAPPADAAKAPRKHRYDCSQEKDPAACEARRKERREKMKAVHEKARQACEGKQGDERRACMIKQSCAQQPEPAKCEARVQERLKQHKQRQGDKK